MHCPVCSHAERAEIEKELLCNPTSGLSGISKKFLVDIKSLQVHALMHTPLDTFPTTEGQRSIVQVLNTKEVEYLKNVADNYVMTLRTLGAKINKIIQDDDDYNMRLISRGVVELYLGCGSQVREIIKDIVAMDGESNGSANGLSQLINAIRES